jgi:hypothetical protein
MTPRARISAKISSVLSILLLSAPLAYAQDPFQDAVKGVSADHITGYLQPFVNAVGANLNSGFYSSASIGDAGLFVRVGVVGMGMLIGDGDKVYKARPPQPYAQQDVQTATVFGGVGATVRGPGGISYQFQSGEVKTSIVPIGVPQITVGNIFGTQAVIRYIPLPSIGDFPKTTLFGAGLRHSISRYIPEFPVDIAAGIGYNKVTVGDIIDAHTLNIGAQASKSFSVATLYGGLQYESSSLTVDYAYSGSGGGNVHLDIDGENKFRVTGGLGLDLVFFHLNGDINIGKVTVVSAGIGFGL